MKHLLIVCLAIMAVGVHAQAQERNYDPVPDYVPTPESRDSKIGKLEFPNGYPTRETANKLWEELL